VTIAEIRRLYEARPFKPFVIHLADGRKVPVEHPEFMLAPPSGQTVFVVEPNGDFHFIDIELVTGLVIKRNGASTRRRGKLK